MISVIKSIKVAEKSRRRDVVQEGEYRALGEGEGVPLGVHVDVELANQVHVVEEVLQVDVSGDG